MVCLLLIIITDPSTWYSKKVSEIFEHSHILGIQPKNTVWSIEDCARFQEQTAGKQFAAQIKAIRKDTTNNQRYILELVLIDVSKKNDVNINDELVKEQRAIQAWSAWNKWMSSIDGYFCRRGNFYTTRFSSKETIGWDNISYGCIIWSFNRN